MQISAEALNRLIRQQLHLLQQIPAARLEQDIIDTVERISTVQKQAKSFSSSSSSAGLPPSAATLTLASSTNEMKKVGTKKPRPIITVSLDQQHEQRCQIAHFLTLALKGMRLCRLKAGEKRPKTVRARKTQSFLFSPPPAVATTSSSTSSTAATTPDDGVMKEQKSTPTRKRGRKSKKDEDEDYAEDVEDVEYDSSDADDDYDEKPRRKQLKRKKSDDVKTAQPSVNADIFDTSRQVQLIECVYDPAVQQNGGFGKRLHKNVIELKEGASKVPAEMSKVTGAWFRESNQTTQSSKNFMFFAPLTEQEEKDWKKTCMPTLFAFRKRIAGKVWREVIPDNISMYRAEDFSIINNWLKNLATDIFGAEGPRILEQYQQKQQEHEQQPLAQLMKNPSSVPSNTNNNTPMSSSSSVRNCRNLMLQIVFLFFSR
jgi:hypothetical protein